MDKRFEPLTREDFADLLDRYPFDRAIDAVHLHHSWRPTRAQYVGEATIETIWRYHTQEKGWRDIGHHVSIAPDGTIWTGRDWNLPPMSARGHDGNDSVGPFMIELIGDFNGRDTLEGPQLGALVEVVARVQKHFDLHVGSLRLHNELDRDRECPGTSIRRDVLEQEIRARRDELMRRDADSRFGGAPAHEISAVVQRLLRLAGSKRWQRSGGSRPEAGERDESSMSLDHEAMLGRAEQATREGPATASRAARSSLTPEALDELRPHLVNLDEGRFSRDGRFRTRPADVDAIFEQHLPLAVDEARRRGGKLSLVFWAHGGLISEEAGLTIAQQQLRWWRRNHVYPIFFVWETGLVDTLTQILRGVRERAAVLERGLTDAFTDPAIERLARSLGGGKVWSGMKRNAELASGADGGARYVAERLVRFCALPGNELVEVHAVGHSAGSIFHAHFLPCAISLGLPKVVSLQLLAPAIRVDHFKRSLVPLVGSRIEHLAMFTMKRDWEEADSVAVYRKSLLYLVSRAFEPEHEAPILGLEESVRDDEDVRRLFGLAGTPSSSAEVVWSKSARDSGRSASTSSTHGGFDNDRATMNSVLRRVTGKTDTDPIFDFPAEAIERSVAGFAAAARTFESADATFGAGTQSQPTNGAGRLNGSAHGPRWTTSGARRALCIGIDEYAVSPLAGCVADANLWTETLRTLRFDVTRLLNREATREAILAGVLSLVRGSRAGDVLAIQFAGHGTLVDDLDGDEQGGNGAKDEALCPYDFASGALVIDDDLADAFAQLPPGVSLTCFMDSCHSGTVTRVFGGHPASAGPSRRARFLPASRELEAAHRTFRAAHHPAAVRASRGPESMREVLFSACLDREQALEVDGQGEFTMRATAVLRGGIDGLTHAEFERRVIAAFGPSPAQHPQLDCAPAARERLLLAPLEASSSASATGNGNGFAPHPHAARPGSNGDLHHIAGEIRDRAERLLRL